MQLYVVWFIIMLTKTIVIQLYVVWLIIILTKTIVIQLYVVLSKTISIQLDIAWLIFGTRQWTCTSFLCVLAAQKAFVTIGVNKNYHGFNFDCHNNRSSTTTVGIAYPKQFQQYCYFPAHQWQHQFSTGTTCMLQTEKWFHELHHWCVCCGEKIQAGCKFSKIGTTLFKAALMTFKRDVIGKSSHTKNSQMWHWGSLIWN